MSNIHGECYVGFVESGSIVVLPIHWYDSSATLRDTWMMIAM